MEHKADNTDITYSDSNTFGVYCFIVSNCKSGLFLLCLSSTHYPSTAPAWSCCRDASSPHDVATAMLNVFPAVLVNLVSAVQTTKIHTNYSSQNDHRLIITSQRFKQNLNIMASTLGGFIAVFF